MLVEALAAQVDGPGQAAVNAQHVFLNLHRQSQVLFPVRVGQAHVVGPHHQHDLGHLFPVDLGLFGVAGAVAADDGVPVNVQHNLDGGILLQHLLDSRQGPGIRAGVAGVVILGLVMDHGQAHVLKDALHLLPHPDHVIAVVGGPGGVRLFIGILPALGVSLRGVGMHDENLRPFLRRFQLQTHFFVKVIRRFDGNPVGVVVHSDGGGF